MSLRQVTPCDFGECPYNAQYNCDCEYWCGAESDDYPEIEGGSDDYPEIEEE